MINWNERAKVLYQCIASNEVWPLGMQDDNGESPIAELAWHLERAYDEGKKKGGGRCSSCAPSSHPHDHTIVV